MSNPETTAITNADFAEIAGYMASHVAKWAAEAMTLREEIPLPMRAEPLLRFIRDMRERLDRLEERANGQ